MEWGGNDDIENPYIFVTDNLRDEDKTCNHHLKAFLFSHTIAQGTNSVDGPGLLIWFSLFI